jgi:hypothetical protein
VDTAPSAAGPRRSATVGKGPALDSGQLLADVRGVEFEDVTDVLEGEGPIGVLAAHPTVDLVETHSVLGPRRGHALFVLEQSLFENGQHELAILKVELRATGEYLVIDDRTTVCI